MIDRFLSIYDLRATNDPKHFSCTAKTTSIQLGDFPSMMKTDVGNNDPLYFNHSIFDGGGNFVGALYRQSDGCEVSVFLT